MPELPEVETVRQGLVPHVVGHVIEKAVFKVPKLRFPLPLKGEALLKGQKVLTLGRRSKFLLFFLENKQILISHLGMSGHFTFVKDGELYEPKKHDHVLLYFQKGGILVYHDPRRFGFMDIIKEVDSYPMIARLGPEAIEDAFSAEYLYKMAQKRTVALKTLLLNQSIVAGLGNIYVCEALWQAGLSPLRVSHKLGYLEAQGLVEACKEVLFRAIKAGGSSLRDFQHTDGTLGYFQHQFRAYGQAGKSCSHAGCLGKIINIKQSGRSSFYCPQHQK